MRRAAGVARPALMHRARSVVRAGVANGAKRASTAFTMSSEAWYRSWRSRKRRHRGERLGADARERDPFLFAVGGQGDRQLRFRASGLLGKCLARTPVRSTAGWRSFRRRPLSARARPGATSRRLCRPCLFALLSKRNSSAPLVISSRVGVERTRVEQVLLAVLAASFFSSSTSDDSIVKTAGRDASFA